MLDGRHKLCFCTRPALPTVHGMSPQDGYSQMLSIPFCMLLLIGRWAGTCPNICAESQQLVGVQVGKRRIDFVYEERDSIEVKMPPPRHMREAAMKARPSACHAQSSMCWAPGSVGQLAKLQTHPVCKAYMSGMYISTSPLVKLSVMLACLQGRVGGRPYSERMLGQVICMTEWLQEQRAMLGLSDKGAAQKTLFPLVDTRLQQDIMALPQPGSVHHVTCMLEAGTPHVHIDSGFHSL